MVRKLFRVISSTASYVISHVVVLISCFLAVLSETVDDRRKRACEKSTSSTHIRPQHQNLSKSRTHSMIPPSKTRPMIQALAPMGSSTASYAQHSINPQLLTLFSPSAAWQYRTGADGVIRDGRRAKLERKNHKHDGTGSQGKLHQLGPEAVENDDTTGSCREPGWRISESQVAPQLRSEEATETKSLCDIERVIIGRKASKKQKSQ